MLLETGWEGYLQSVDGHIDHRFSNNVAQQVIFDFPTATDAGKAGLGPGGQLLGVNKLDHINAFVSDQWSMGRMTLNLGVRWDRYKAHYPEQQQLAFEILPGCASRTDIICSIPAASFPGATVATFNSVVPRVGFIFDLSGDGKTVIKANYGLYRHNPGVALAGSGNQNSTLKTVTYSWTDPNGDRRFQLGEQGALTATALAGTITVDPDLKQPYSHDMGIFLEREIMNNLGGRVGFVYKSNDDLYETENIATRPHSAFTQPFNFVDIGEDGVRGTGDDRNLTFLGLPNALASQFPVTNVVMNVPSFARYKTVEASIVKRMSDRWSATIGGGHTWSHDFPQNYPSNPNGLFDAKYTGWGFKLSGIYDGPWGIRFSPLFRHQSGPAFGRNTTVSSSNPIVGSTTVYVEPYDSRRQDNINVLDLRTEKVVNLTGQMRVRLFLDVFNITNSHASETITTTTGVNFLRPAAILAPRVARVGFRFIW
jgi:hypothetical protein